MYTIDCNYNCLFVITYWGILYEIWVKSSSPQAVNCTYWPSRPLRPFSHLQGSLARTGICFSIEFAELSYNIRSTSVLWPRLCYKAAARGCWQRVRTPDVKVVSVFGRIQGGLLLNRWCCSCHQKVGVVGAGHRNSRRWCRLNHQDQHDDEAC